MPRDNAYNHILKIRGHVRDIVTSANRVVELIAEYDKTGDHQDHSRSDHCIRCHALGIAKVIIELQ